MVSRCWSLDHDSPSMMAATTYLPTGDHNARSDRSPAAERRCLRPAVGDREVFDELKTHQRGSKVVLRSKSPDLVLQEIWGYLKATSRFAHHDPSRRPRRTRSRPPQFREQVASCASPTPSRCFSPTTVGPSTGTGRHSYVDSSTASSPHDGDAAPRVIKRHAQMACETSASRALASPVTPKRLNPPLTERYWG
jgi:hypothetical protein